MDEKLLTTIGGLGVSWLLITIIAYNWMKIRLKAAVKFEYDAKVKLINHGYNEQLAQYKIKLQHESAISVVKLTKELEVKAAERNIKLTRVFERQAIIIADTYAKLLIVLNAAEEYTSLLPYPTDAQRVERQNVFVAACNDFYKAYHPNKIYFPRDAAKQIQELFGAATSLTHKHARAEILANANQPNEYTGELIDKFNSQIQDIQNKIPSLLKELEAKFQKIFGITNDEMKS